MTKRGLTKKIKFGLIFEKLSNKQTINKTDNLYGDHNKC